MQVQKSPEHGDQLRPREWTGTLKKGRKGEARRARVFGKVSRREGRGRWQKKEKFSMAW